MPRRRPPACAAPATARPWPACSSGERQVRICERRRPGRRESSGRRCTRRRSGGPSGALAQVVEVWRDISERRAAEARLAESHRLASLGHARLGLLARAEHAARHGAHLRRGNPARRAGGQRGTRPDVAPASRESATVAREQLLRCRGITQHFLRLSRGQGSPRRPRRPRADPRRGRPAHRADGARPLGGGSTSSRSQAGSASGSTRRSCSTC